MALRVIRVPKNVPFSTQRQTLDGVDYVVTFHWNSRGGWFMGLSDANGSVIFHPRRIVLGVDLLRPFRFDERCPPGILLAYDMSHVGTQAGYLDLVAGGSYQEPDGRVMIAYQEATT